MSARWAASSARTSLQYSIPCRCRRLRRRPAVSISRNRRSPRSKIVSIASRVVPGVGATITRGRPRMRVHAATTCRRSGGRGSRRGSRRRPRAAPRRPRRRRRARCEPLDDRVQQVAGPAAVQRRHARSGRPGRARAARARRPRGPCRRPCSRPRARAAGSGAGCRPAPRRRRPARRGRRSTSSTRSASSTAWRAWSATWACMCDGSPASTPPVSTSTNSRPFQSHGTSFRSRVTPGVSSTTALREPVQAVHEGRLPGVRVADHRHHGQGGALTRPVSYRRRISAISSSAVSR